MEHGVESSQQLSLQPCGEGAALPGPPFPCAATASGRNLNDEVLDLNGRLALSQLPCEEGGGGGAPACAAPCLPESALQGYCPPGQYTYLYSVRGTTATRRREVVVTAKAAISLELIFLAPAPIPLAIIPILEVRHDG